MRTSPTMIIWWKEVRSILPLWGVLLLAMIVPSLLGMRPFGEPPGEWLLGVLVVGGAGLATLAYGREFHNRTMTWQLVLPGTRLVLLTRKFVVLTVALASLIGLLAALEPRLFAARYMVASVLVLAALALTSACLFSAVLRNMLATLMLTFAMPVVVLVLLSTVMEPLSRWFRLEPEVVALGSLLLYSLATGVAAVLLWRRMELRNDAVVASGIDVAWSCRVMGDT